MCNAIPVIIITFPLIHAHSNVLSSIIFQWIAKHIQTHIQAIANMRGGKKTHFNKTKAHKSTLRRIPQVYARNPKTEQFRAQLLAECRCADIFAFEFNKQRNDWNQDRYHNGQPSSLASSSDQIDHTLATITRIVFSAVDFKSSFMNHRTIIVTSYWPGRRADHISLQRKNESTPIRKYQSGS